MAYDIFISYRRRGAGAGVAGEMQAKLQNRGFKVFLDVDNIGSGAFPQQIDQAIRECNDFLLILSPNMLDRCVEEEDWVRHEIALAESYGKNIVGVSLPGFIMPEASALPEPLKDIPEKQVFIWSHEYRNASFEKIVENLESLKRKKSKKRKSMFVVMGVAAAIVAALVALQFLKPKPEQSPEEVAVIEHVVPIVDTAKLVRDTFNLYVRRADSLMKLIPEPMRKDEQDFRMLMQVMKQLNSALAMKTTYPWIPMDNIGIERRADSLDRLRKELFEVEIDAVKKFVDVGLMEPAETRYQNAVILATDDDQKVVETIEKKLKKKK